MRKQYLILIFILFCVSNFSLEAKLKKLNLAIDDFALTSNIYSYIQIIDDRPETEKKELAIDEYDLNTKINSILTSTAGHKTLVIQLNKIYYLKNTEEDTETYFLQARSYEKNDNKKQSYFWLNTLNTSFANNFKDKQANKKILSDLVTFIDDQLKLIPQSYDPEYETSDFDNIPLLEKNRIPAYTATILKDGIYYDYPSFANQTPSLEIATCKFNKDTSLKDVYYFDAKKGKEQKVKKSDIFGVVIDGNFFLQNKNQYVAAYKDADNDFYFRSLNVSSNGFSIVMASQFGLIGGLVSAMIPSNTKTEDNIIIIDHLSGELSLKSKKITKTRDSILMKNPKVLNEETVKGDGSLKKKW